MKARITLPTGTVIEVDASAEEIRRLAGEPGYKLQMLPVPATAVCICGRNFSTIVPWQCPVHGAPAHITWRPVAGIGLDGAPLPSGSSGWIGTVVARG